MVFNNRDNDLSAIEYINGTKKWFLNGKLYRENDLPAIEDFSGTKEWYWRGKRIYVNNQEEFEEKLFN